MAGGFFVPPFLDQVLEAATTTHANADLSRLRFVLTGGRHLSPRTIRQAADRLGNVLYLYYATTETGINTMAGPAELAADPYSSGYCMPGVTVRALDPATLRELPPGQVGLLAIDTAYAVDGYLHRSLDTVTIGGRRHILTSDYGRASDGGPLHVTARAAGRPSAREAGLDVVRAEGVLKEDPAVRDACVTSVADEAVHNSPHGERRAVAAVVLRTGLAPQARERALRRAANALGSLVGRCTVTEVAQIPYNSAGKVAWQKLRQELE
jgi:acyl-coenzyme A synthetase/AMP-(fatty) acid ligase